MGCVSDQPASQKVGLDGLQERGKPLVFRPVLTKMDRLGLHFLLRFARTASRSSKNKAAVPIPIRKETAAIMNGSAAVDVATSHSGSCVVPSSELHPCTATTH